MGPLVLKPKQCPYSPHLAFILIGQKLTRTFLVARQEGAPLE